MANRQHLERLQQGVQRWNQWRLKNPRVRPDLSEATLLAAQLNGVNLSGTKLCRVRLDNAELSGADLYKADLSGAHLSESNLNGAKLRRAKLRGIKLGRTDLRGANLSKAYLSESDLSGANLSGANLSGANLCKANLSGANLSHTNLSDVWLINTQVLGTVFSKALLTGACIQDWHPNSATILEGVICEYVYLKDLHKERHPKDRFFKPGEFSRIFQQISGVVDLIFQGRIDWQAFFQSFQTLCQQYAEANLSIQTIEKKRGGAFVVRLETSANVDTDSIENRAKELYMLEMHALDTQYKQRLRSQGSSFGMARHSINMERRDKATLMGVMKTMAHSQQGPNYHAGNSLPADSIASPSTHKPNTPRSQHSSATHGPVDPMQAKVIELLLLGMSPTTITKLMQLKPGQVRFYQQQSDFRTIFWRTFLNKMLKLVRLLMTILQNLTNDTQIKPHYSLWLLRWWLATFSVAVDYRAAPNVPVLQSEIMHLLLLGMTRKEVSDALMLDLSQIDDYRQRPAFRVAFWCAYCHKLLTLISQATDMVKALLTQHQTVPNLRLLAVGCLLENFPKDFARILDRMELEQMACMLLAIGAGPIACASASL